MRREHVVALCPCAGGSDYKFAPTAGITTLSAVVGRDIAEVVVMRPATVLIIEDLEYLRDMVAELLCLEALPGFDGEQRTGSRRRSRSAGARGAGFSHHQSLADAPSPSTGGS